MTEPADHLCAIGNRPHPAEAGHLCNNHYGKLADTIRDIVIETEQLSAVPSMAITNSRGGTLASHRAPARLDVLTLTDRRRNAAGLGDWDHTRYDDTPEVLDTLGSWARVVREERGLTMWPTTPVRVRALTAPYIGPFCLRCDHPTCDRMTFFLDVEIPTTVTTESSLLTKHLAWIAEQAWVDEAYDELRKLLSTLKRVNGDPDDKPIGRCYLPQHDGTCNGPIWLDTIQAIAHCGHCGEYWTGTQLAHLNWEMEMARRPHIDGQPMRTVAELAQTHSTTQLAMRRRLNRNGAQSHDGYYDPRLADEKVSA